MTSHFFENYLVDGGEKIIFAIAALGALAGILILTFGKSPLVMDVAKVCFVLAAAVLVFGALVSNAHYHVQHVKNEMRSQGYDVVSLDLRRDQATFGNGGCELVYRIGVLNGRYAPYAVVDGVNGLIRAKDIAAICSAVK